MYIHCGSYKFSLLVFVFRPLQKGISFFTIFSSAWFGSTLITAVVLKLICAKSFQETINSFLFEYVPDYCCFHCTNQLHLLQFFYMFEGFEWLCMKYFTLIENSEEVHQAANVWSAKMKCIEHRANWKPITRVYSVVQIFKTCKCDKVIYSHRSTSVIFTLKCIKKCHERNQSYMAGCTMETES